MNTACRALVTMARCGARAETLRKLPILSRLRSLFIANFARLMRPRLLFQPPGGGFYDYDSTCRFMHVWPANCRQLRTPSKVALLHSMSLRSERGGAKAAPKWMVSLDHGYEWVSPTSEPAY